MRKNPKTIDRSRYLTMVNFLIKFNLLAIPMYFILVNNITYYPLQDLLTGIVYSILRYYGLWVFRNDIALTIFTPVSPPGPPLVETVVMGFDCTAWKTMYAFAALVMATPLPDWKGKMRFILVGSVALFAVNVYRIVSTIMIAYTFGFEYLGIMHTLLWREGLILVLLGFWYLWVRNQKNNIIKSQSVFIKLNTPKAKQKAKKKRR